MNNQFQRVADVGELYKNNKILRISDYIKLLNCLFVKRYTNRFDNPPFPNYFIKSENLHQYNNRHAQQNSVILAQWNTDFHGIKSIQHQAATTWNKLQMKQATKLFYKIVPCKFVDNRKKVVAVVAVGNPWK